MLEQPYVNAHLMQLGGLATGRRSGPLWMVLLFGALLFITSVSGAAANMPVDQFITAMESAFNPDFLSGGQATYVGRSARDVHGVSRVRQAASSPEVNGDLA
jgi:hypothetical protein